jgi:hypothetical protein
LREGGEVLALESTMRDLEHLGLEPGGADNGNQARKLRSQRIVRFANVR